MQNYEYKLLADYPDLIPDLAQLWLEYLGGRWNPHFTLEEAKERIINHCNSDQLPMAWATIANNKPVAMVALRLHELGSKGPIKPECSPWLGALVVHPNYRHQGIAKKLIEIVKAQARKLSYSNLYLLTFESSLVDWYKQTNWKIVDTDELFGCPITIMKINLS